MRRTVLVTGADSGIGLATVLRVAEVGFNAVGLVRDHSAEDTLRSEALRRRLHVDTVVADLSRPEARRDVATAISPWGLVNNAGFMNAGRIRDVPLADARRQLEVMVLAPVDLVHQVLPAMIDRGQGRVVNVTSSAVHTSTPLTGWYTAAKAALREVNDALRIELRGTGVDVVDVEPGGYRTGIWAGAAEELRRRRSRSDERRSYDRALAHMGEGERIMGDADQVGAAVAALLTMGQPPDHFRVGPGARLLRFLDPLVPDRVWDPLMAALARSDPSSPR